MATDFTVRCWQRVQMRSSAGPISNVSHLIKPFQTVPADSNENSFQICSAVCSIAWFKISIYLVLVLHQTCNSALMQKPVGVPHTSIKQMTQFHISPIFNNTIQLCQQIKLLHLLLLLRLYHIAVVHKCFNQSNT